MQPLGPGISLNQPAPSTNRANRRPLFLVISGVAIVVAFGVWASVQSSNQAALASSLPPTTKAGPATTAKDELLRNWNEAKPVPVPAPAPVVVANAVPAPAPHQRSYQLPAPIQPTLAEQEVKRREAEERAAWDSPLSQQGNGSAREPQAGMMTSQTPQAPLTPGHSDETEYLAQNLSASKKNFAQVGQDKTQPLFSRRALLPPYIIQAGHDIPAIMVQATNSDLPGELRARVRENVYDTPTGSYILIPQNSILTGHYNSDVSYGQNRVQVNWDRLNLPGAIPTIWLNKMNGVDQEGAAGLGGHVNNHYGRLIGFAALSSAFAAGIEVSQRSTYGTTGGYPPPGAMAGAAAGVQMGEFGRRITERNLNRQPTIELKPGQHFNVRVDRDMVFTEPWR